VGDWAFFRQGVCRFSCCVARLKADLVRPGIYHISFLVHSDAAIVHQDAKVIWEPCCIDLILWSRDSAMTILRGESLEGVKESYGKVSGAWTHNFMRRFPCRQQARAESCNQHVRKSTKSIDKTAKSIVAFDSINYGVYFSPDNTCGN